VLANGGFQRMMARLGIKPSEDAGGPGAKDAGPDGDGGGGDDGAGGR